MRLENAKFEIPVIPRSNIPGVTFNRVIKQWEVRVKEGPSYYKYVGSFVDLQKAIDFQKEITQSEVMVGYPNTVNQGVRST